MGTDRNGREMRDPFGFVVALSGPAWAARLPNLLHHADSMPRGPERSAHGTGSSAAGAIMTCSARRGILSSVSQWLSARR